MLPKNIVSKILWSAIEDFIGLWEILWELNSLQNKVNEKAEAIKIIRLLLDNDLIKLYVSRWGTTKLKELSNEEDIRILADARYWDAPEINQECIKVGSTRKGEDYYNSNKIEDLATG